VRQKAQWLCRKRVSLATGFRAKTGLFVRQRLI
jgi:hypothetical protein